MVTAALKGARIIYLDYERWNRDRYRHTQPCIPLARVGAFWRSRFVEGRNRSVHGGAGSSPELGDASPVIERFDPYRDGMASQRVGSYLQWYLEARDEGMNKEAAIKEANVKYADRWGQSRVVRGL